MYFSSTVIAALLVVLAVNMNITPVLAVTNNSVSSSWNHTAACLIAVGVAAGGFIATGGVALPFLVAWEAALEGLTHYCGR